MEAGFFRCILCSMCIPNPGTSQKITKEIGNEDGLFIVMDVGRMNMVMLRMMYSLQSIIIISEAEVDKMSMRNELSEIGKGIKRVQKHIKIMEQLEYIKENFINNPSSTGDIDDYIKELKPKSLKDGVMKQLIFALKDGG